MGFWNIEPSQGGVAAIDARSGQSWTYEDLRRDLDGVRQELPRTRGKSLGLLLAQNRYECLAVYLAALNSDCALMLLDAGLNPELLANLIETYRPDWIYTATTAAPVHGYQQSSTGRSGLLVANSPEHERGRSELHPDLALLLSTSGSTGSAKLVRLRHANLAANAASIAEYLGLTSAEKPITSLPMPYSYGLSVINSHLHVGATIVLSDDGVLRREFWEAIDRYGCTSFAGVPYTYQLLLQAGLLGRKGATLRTLTQAGGRLEERYVDQMLKLAGDRGWRFFVMYGQTEATARISYVPSERLSAKKGSIGVAVPGGSLSTDAATGELVYSGPNVMMGYAETLADLALGDELEGVLRTGDRARRDEDGFCYITGRLKRFIKLFGKRFNLDDVERVLSAHTPGALACYGRDELLMIAVEQCRDTKTISDLACRLFDLPRNAVKVTAVTELPRTTNGKLDYQSLNEAGLEQAPAVIG